MAKQKGWYWPWLVAGLMAVVIGANLVLIYLATSDPSFAVEEDYYQKALAWDDRRAQDLKNSELGWTLDFAVASNRSADGSVTIDAVLRDAEGRSIGDASVRLEAFHNARAAYILRTAMKRSGDGSYRASLPMRRPGLWEFRFEVTRGGERFTRTTMKELFWR